MSEDLTKKVFLVLEGMYDAISNKRLSEIVENFLIKDDIVYFAIPTSKVHLKHYQTLLAEAKTKLDELSIRNNLTLINNSPKSIAAIDGVKKVIVVASGKGGVGKSTVAYNLAISLANSGAKVGIVDVDIYGPSLPKLSGVNEKPVVENNMVIPQYKHGIYLMSVGYLINQDDALIWRGPMTSKMLYQLIRMTKWSCDKKDLDYLIIDTPPGTGDVHLSLYEQYKVDGVVVVTSPQAMVVDDVRRALVMFEKFKIPIIGIIENMSYFQDADGVIHNIFGVSNENQVLSLNFGAKFYEKLPLYPELSIACDKGRPITYYDQRSECSKKFQNIANQVLLYLN